MFQQSPYAMHPRQYRDPQHAAALGGNTVLRGRLRRAMKLIAISAVWITGLFIVIAAVTIVALATAPIAQNSSAAEAQQAPAGRAAIAGAASADRDTPVADRSTPQVGASAPARILTVFLGLGSANTSQFTIGGSGTWKLGWSYHCAGTGPPGTFTISQPGPGSAYVDRRGMTGHGVILARHDAGTHYLAIRTRCRWRLTVDSHP